MQDQLKIINAGIRGVSIQQPKDSLVLVATLPAKVVGRKPHQQRIPTGHKADGHGLKLAHKQALQLASARASGTFEWSDWTRQPDLPAITSTPAALTVPLSSARRLSLTIGSDCILQSQRCAKRCNLMQFATSFDFASAWAS